MGWRHALADTANFDRGLTPADGEPVLDLGALRRLSPYGLVAMACLAAHNDRLLAPTRVVPPTNPLATAELVAAGFGFVVREFLCPVAGPPLPLPAAGGRAVAAGARGAEPLAAGSLPSGSLAYGPLAGGPRSRAPEAPPPAVALQPVHDAFEEAAVAEAAVAALDRSVAPDHLDLLMSALRLLGDNRRRHAGSFDGYVALSMADGGRGPLVELAVGDCGMGLRAAAVAAADEAVGDLTDDADAVDRVMGADDRALGDLVRRVTAVGGTVLVRSGAARHTACATGTVRARVPWVRGTIVAVSLPAGEPLRRPCPVVTVQPAAWPAARSWPGVAAPPAPGRPAEPRLLPGAVDVPPPPLSAVDVPPPPSRRPVTAPGPTAEVGRLPVAEAQVDVGVSDHPGSGDAALVDAG